MRYCTYHSSRGRCLHTHSRAHTFSAMIAARYGSLWPWASSRRDRRLSVQASILMSGASSRHCSRSGMSPCLCRRQTTAGVTPVLLGVFTSAPASIWEGVRSRRMGWGGGWGRRCTHPRYPQSHHQQSSHPHPRKHLRLKGARTYVLLPSKSSTSPPSLQTPSSGPTASPNQARATPANRGRKTRMQRRTRHTRPTRHPRIGPLPHKHAR